MTNTLLSPEGRISQRQKKMNADRTKRLKESLVTWSTAFVIIGIETFLFKGYFLSWMLPFVPYTVLSWIEFGLFVYVVTAIVYLAVTMIFGPSEFLSSIIPLVSAPRQKPSYLLSNPNESHISRRSEKSWVEDIQFGTPSEKSFLNTSSNMKSPLNNPYVSSTDILSSIALSSPIGKSTPHAKPVDSIHTREQLDRYLRKEAENSFLDVSASSAINNSFTYFNMLDISGGDRKPYQVSEKNVTESKENTSVLRLPTDTRVHLNPIGSAENDTEALSQLRTAILAAKEAKKATGSPMLRRAESVLDRRRSRSHSSPTPQHGSHTIADSECGGSLDEIDLTKAEHKLRAWIVRSILIPLRDQIKKVNIELEKEHANPPLRIGVSSVEAFKTALSTRDSLRTSFLPFVIPYLQTHSNQAYIISRIAELAGDAFMVSYNWNGGGSEAEEKATSTTNRNSRRRWHEGLPTDSELVFSIFSVFMDYHMTSNPLVGNASLGQPFTALYTLNAPNKPSSALCAPGSFYLHMVNVAPPHVDFVYVTEGGRIPMKTAVAKGSANLFQAIVHFIHHAKTQNGGKIDMVSVGPTGLGIASVLD